MNAMIFFCLTRLLKLIDSSSFPALDAQWFLVLYFASLPACTKYRMDPLRAQNIKISFFFDDLKNINILIILKTSKFIRGAPAHPCPRALSTKRGPRVPKILKILKFLQIRIFYNYKIFPCAPKILKI